MKKLYHIYEENDCIAWEIFKQITSKYLDSLSTDKRINKIIKFRKKRINEINNLVIKCHQLAEQYKGEKDLCSLERNIAEHIKINVEKELNEFLCLKKLDFNKLIGDIFSDYKVWASISGIIYSAYQKQELGLAAAGITLFSATGSKLVQNAIKTNSKINSSSYKLIYLMK